VAVLSPTGKHTSHTPPTLYHTCSVHAPTLYLHYWPIGSHILLALTLVRYAGAPLPPLQPVERPAKSALESGGKGDGLESGQMPTRAGL